MANAKESTNALTTKPGTETKTEISVLQTLLKATIQMSDEALEGMFRGATVKKNLDVKAIEKISFGTVNSALRIGDLFKIVGIKVIVQPVQGMDRELMLLIVQNPKGEQRAIYASSIFRTPPTANSENNKYEQDVLNFDLGVLANTQGMSTPKRLEKLVGNGTDFLEVTEEISYVTTGVRVQQGPRPEDTPGSKFDAQQRVFQLQFVSEADAIEKAA